MALAGLAEHWVGADGSELETMAILHHSANATMQPFHDRMPVIIAPEHFDVCSDCTTRSSKFAETLLMPPLFRPPRNPRRQPSPQHSRNEGPDRHQPPEADKLSQLSENTGVWAPRHGWRQQQSPNLD